jgi:hypothetical protein
MSSKLVHAGLAVAATLAIPAAVFALAPTAAMAGVQQYQGVAKPAQAAGAPDPLPTGTVIAQPDLNVRFGPAPHELQQPVDYTLPTGTVVTILCTLTSDYVTGPYGRTNIWDMVGASEGHGDFASDAWINTGTNNPVAPRC